MSLTHEDLQQIEAIFDKKLDPVFGELQALREDIKEIYIMISELQAGTFAEDAFSKKSLEEKLLTLNSKLLAAAKQAGIALPRS